MSRHTPNIYIYILRWDVTIHSTKRTRAVLAEIMITCTSIFADQLRTVSAIQLTQYRVALGKWILQSNMKRDYLPWWPSSHVKIEHGRLILARSLQWAKKEWKDENWRFSLKCKLGLWYYRHNMHKITLHFCPITDKKKPVQIRFW